ncbi:unnamed protein product, partial [Iphiclides podalirius]
MVVYGMTMGYHTGQTELAHFAVKSRNVTNYVTIVDRRFYKGNPYEARRRLDSDDRLNESNLDSILDLYDTRPPTTTNAHAETPIVIEFTERLSNSTEPVSAEKFDSKKNIGRLRRSKDNIFKNIKISFWRPYKKEEQQKNDKIK